MKKYIILLIVPFLLFHVGCEKSEDYDRDYSELILGHWELTSYNQETTSVTTLIDPVFGTETTTTNSSTVSLSPPFSDSYLISLSEDYQFYSKYYTYRYDNTFIRDIHMYSDDDLLNQSGYGIWEGTYSIQGGVGMDPVTTQEIPIPYTLSLMGDNGSNYDYTIQLSDSEMTKIYEYSTTSIVSDEEYIVSNYVIIEGYSKISEIPSP